MGIPKLFRFLSKNYRSIISPTKPNRSTVEWFGIDFNSLMHPVCAQLSAANETVNYKKREHWPILYEAILDYLKQVLRQLSDTGSVKDVFIAIDGVVPMAKIIQQRQRRFRSAAERFKKKTNWDSCLISPGTFFMSQFERFLAKHLKELNDLKGYESTRFRLSDSRSFGEGEHKIMKEIRALKKDTSIAIYGLDADLIILGISVSQQHSQIQLFRENVHCALKEYAKEDYLLVHIQKLWKYVVDEITGYMEAHQEVMKEKGQEPTLFTVDQSSLIRDFILLSCYFGNDFLPAIPAASLTLNDSITYILRSYAFTLAEEGTYMSQKVTESVFYWNQPFLLKFWNTCQITENDRMRLKTNEWIRTSKHRRPRSGDKIDPKWSPIHTFNAFSPGKQRWMKSALSSAETYLTVFDSCEPEEMAYLSSDTQSAMIREWLRGSIWVLSYYTGVAVDPFWWYIWSAPPSFSHLILYHHDVIKESTKVDIVEHYLTSYRRKKMGRPTLALQTMTILPVDSEYSISKRKLGWDKLSHPRHMYTPEYHENGKLKYSVIWANWFHECHAYLPLIELPFIVHSLS